MKTYLQFADRIDAAYALAERLQDFDKSNPLILAIPRGGVPIAEIIAERLHGELDVVLVRKLGAPFNPEFAIGAIDETGITYLGPAAEKFGEHHPHIEQAKAAQLAVLKNRRARYTPHRNPIDPQQRVTIIVDDGIATGSTMIAALHAIRARNPTQLICAVPVAPPTTLRKITPLADKIVCVHAPSEFVSVGQFYRDFRAVDDDTVIGILAAAGVRKTI